LASSSLLARGADPEEERRSLDRLHWARCRRERATLPWMGVLPGHRVQALGVDRFDQSADLPDFYRVHRLDADAILDACATALLRA
jgi:pyruvate dehydrogenase complex dehydrogenase (E1) component